MFVGDDVGLNEEKKPISESRSNVEPFVDNDNIL